MSIEDINESEATRKTRIAQAKTHTKQSSIRLDQAKTKSEQASTEAAQADTRSQQAETHAAQTSTHTEQTKTQTEQSNTRSQQAETKSDQDSTHAKQAGTRFQQEETQAVQATTHTEQSKTRTEQARIWDMEVALRASELSYRRLFEAAQDGILILEIETGRITDVNPFLEKLLGFSHSEMVGKTVGELSPFKDIVSNRAMLELLQKDGYVRYEDLPLETRDGRHIAVEFVSNVYQAGEKQVIQCNIRDITARKKGQEASVLLTAIVESSEDAIIGKDIKGIVNSWNRGAVKIFGYSVAEMIGESILKLIPAERHGEEKLILERISQGKSVIHFETVRITKTGRLIDVSVTASPIKDTYGKVVGASKVARDITDRKEMEKALRDQEEMFRTMANSIPQMAFAGMADGYIHWYNQRWYDYTGTTPEQVEGWGWQTVHDPKSLPQMMEKWRAAIISGRPFEIESPIRAADGSYRNFLTRVVPTKDTNGMVAHWFGTNTDVEDLREAERKVQLLNAELEQRVVERTAELEAFSYSVSHDLRAPVRAIGGFARMVQESYGPQLPPEANRKLARIHENAVKLGQLIDGLLAFSKLGHQQLSKRKVLPLLIVSQVLEELQAEQPDRNLQVSVLELPACHADPTLLLQVFTNLISNAFKYTREQNPAVIEIGSRTEQGQCVYYVKDNGAGFDPAYADKLFGVFQRLHREDQFQGTGVGLAIVRRIIQRHGGKIWAESQVDKGATFSFTLENGE